MVSKLLLGIGLVLAIEGLVLALAPNRIEELLDVLRSMSIESRRILGLGAIGGGVVLLWLARLITV